MAKEQQEKTKSSVRNEGEEGREEDAAEAHRRNQSGYEGDVGTGQGEGYLACSRAPGVSVWESFGGFKILSVPFGPAAASGLLWAQGSTAHASQCCSIGVLPALGGHDVHRFPSGL